MEVKNIKVGNLFKSFNLKGANIDKVGRTVEITFASEIPYERENFIEIIDLTPGSMDLTKLNNSAALLFNHDFNTQIGVVERTYIDPVDKKAKALIRFSSNPRANEFFNDVVDGIMTKISFGYEVTDMELVGYQGDKPIMRVKTIPFEISLVTIPADDSVGVGRSKQENVKEFKLKVKDMEEMKDMKEDTYKADSSDIDNNDPPTENQDDMEEEVEEGKKSKKMYNEEDDCDCEEDDDCDCSDLEDKCSDTDMQTKEDMAEMKMEKPDGEDKLKSLSPTVAKSNKENIINNNNNKKGISNMDISKNIQEIVALGDRFKNFGGVELANTFIRNAKYDVSEFNAAILAKMETAGAVQTASNPHALGLSSKEVKNYSLFRAIVAKMNGTNCVELEMSKDLEKQLGKTSKGILVPQDYLKRDLSVGAFGSGGALVATDLRTQDFVELLRNKTVIKNLGATFLSGLEGNVAIPRQTTGASVGWVNENGVIAESSAQFDQLAMSPKTVGAFTDISRLLMLQGSMDPEAFVLNELATVIALELDRVAVYGTGTANMPKGIINTAGIGSVSIGANGGYANWQNVIDLETQVATQNAELGRLSYLTNPKVRGKLKATQKGVNLGFIYENGDIMNGYSVGVTNQIASNGVHGTGTGLSTLIYGNFQDLVIGQWGNLDIQVDPYTQATKGAVRITAFQDVDMVVRHAGSFAAITDIQTS